MIKHVMWIVAAVALLLGGGGEARAAIIFNFQFDNHGFGDPDGVIIPPVVGTGTFSLATDPGNGTFTLASLGAFTASFIFGTTTFTQADISSDPNLTRAVITGFGSERRLYFSDPGAGGGGPENGSLDLNKGADFLTFEPTFFGGHNLYQEMVGANLFQGNYLGVTSAVPEPATLTLLGLSSLGLLGYGWRRRKQPA
jgi:hypothetical protein